MGILSTVGDVLSGGGISAGREQRQAINTAKTGLQQGFNTATGQVQQGYGQAQQTLNPLLGSTSGAEQNFLQKQDSGGFSNPNAGPFNFNFQADPGYEFSLDQGRKQLLGNAEAGGMSNSGATQKALLDYGTNAAAKEYGDVYNRQRGAYESDRTFGGQNANQEFQHAQQAGNPAFALAGTQANLQTGEGNALADLTGQNAASQANLDIGKGNVNAGIQAAGYSPITALLGKGINTGLQALTATGGK